MAEDVETPELVELQDTFAKTESTVVNELPSESESSEKPFEQKAESGGLTENQKKNLPEALQKAILAKQSGGSDKKDEEESHEEPMNLDTIEESSEEKVEEKKEDMFAQPTETEEPAGEFTPPVEETPINPTPVVDTVNRAEIYAAHSLAQKVASMPLAEYEDWLFPPHGSPDHLRGQMCLARIDASLKAANGGRAVAELWQVKIGAALWSRLNFRDNPVEETRCELEKAPPMELIPLIPRNASEAISVIEEIQTGKSDTSDTNWGVLGACGVAVLLPILLLRRG